MMDQLRQIFRRTPPKINPNVAGRPEVAWSESKLYNADFPKYNPDELIGRKGFKIYRQMMVDEQVKAVMKFKRDAITSREIVFRMPNSEGKLEAPDSEANKRVQIYEAMIRNTFGSFTDGMNFILMAMYQGFSLTEKLIDIFEFENKPYLGIKELIPKPFETFEFYTDKFGQIQRTVQKLDNQEKSIDLDRFVYYVQNPEFDRHYGQSDLRAAYRAWYSKDVIIRFYNQFLERFAGGFVIGKPTSGSSITPGTPNYNALLAAMDSIQTQASILLPHNVEIDVERPSTTDQFQMAIELHDLSIAKALLIPNLLGITPQATSGGGGYAQANTQLEAFLWTLDSDAKRLEESVNEQIFEPLSKLNFADGVGPRMQFKAVSDTKKLEIVKTWKELVVGGAAEATDTDEHYLRELLNFPYKGEPLNLQQKVGDPSAVPPQSRTRGPVEEPNQQRRKTASRAFSRATNRVSFAVIERRANKLEDDAVIKVENQIASMVSDLATRISEEKLGTPASDTPIDTIDFNPRQKNKVKKALERVLAEAWTLGVRHAKDEIGMAHTESIQINMARVDEFADEFLRSSAYRAFGVMNDDMKRIVQQVLANAVKFSWTTDEIIRKVYDSLTKAGFITLNTNIEATGRTARELEEAIETALGGAHRVRTAVRTNAFEAINEARYSAFTDPQLDGFVVAMEYSAILDSRTTDICRHLDDRVYAVDDPIWNGIRPPNHFNCRSILVPVTIIDEEVTGKDNVEGSRWSRPPSISPQTGFGG